MTFVDMDGKPVALKHSNSIDLVSVCGGDLPDYGDLKYYVRVFNCTSSSSTTGFKIQYQYKFSWNNNIVLVSPYNSSNKTKGVVTM